MIFIFFFVIGVLSAGGGFVVYNECAFGYLNGCGRFGWCVSACMSD